MYAAAYSGFEGVDADGRTLAQILREGDIAEVDVVGLVESHCVKETALDANKLGLVTRVLTDLTVPVSPELGAKAREQLTPRAWSWRSPACPDPGAANSPFGCSRPANLAAAEWRRGCGGQPLRASAAW